MPLRSVSVTMLVLLGVAGCSATPDTSAPLRGVLLPGTAQVSVNGSDIATTYDVQCQTIVNGFTSINVGKAPTRIAMIVDDNIPKGITFNDVNGFTGSYWQDLQGSADLRMIDQTYTLTGTAAGFDASHPATSTTNDFAITVAC